MVVDNGVTDCVPPLAGSVYEMPSVPVRVSWVAYVAETVRVAGWPATMELGLATRLALGTGLGAIATVAVAEAWPPGPFAVAVYTVVLIGLTVCCALPDRNV